MKDNSFLIGWSGCDITPQRPIFLFGQFYERLSTHVRDPLTATACAIEGDGGEVVLVSCDLALITEDLMRGVRAAVCAKCPQMKPESIILSAIHTHTGPDYQPPEEETAEASPMFFVSSDRPAKHEGAPMSPQEVYALLVERLCGVILDAVAKKKPMDLSIQMEYCTVGFNRIMMYKDKSARMYGNCETADFEGVLGAADPGVEMVFTFGADGVLEGVILEVACPSQVVEHHSFVSADYWGETRKLLRERFGDIFVLPLCGPAGDLSPRDMVRLKRESSLRKGESPLNSHMPEADITRPGWEMYDERGLFIIAKRLERAVCDAYEKAKDNIGKNTTLRHVCLNLPLPMLRVSLEDYLASYQQCIAILQKNGLDPEKDWFTEETPSLVKEEMYVPYGIVRRYEIQQKTDVYPVEIHLFRIGDAAFYSVPFELFCEYGFRIRARAKYDHVVGIQLACGSAGYLPVQRAVDGKAYSAIAASNTIGPEGGTLLATIIADTLNSF